MKQQLHINPTHYVLASLAALRFTHRSTPLTQPTGVSGNEIMKVETLVKEASLAEPAYHALLEEVMKEVSDRNERRS